MFLYNYPRLYEQLPPWVASYSGFCSALDLQHQETHDIFLHLCFERIGKAGRVISRGQPSPFFLEEGQRVERWKCLSRFWRD